ncbi:MULTISPECIES: helix-turn-helix domain-containing protein [Providencia]|uniref:XRE family transcriptional regulator n=2 Tax=Providencia rettgeri TaxID=587 RepID=A0A219X568_PRORE|nr:MULTISPECIES: helix-turn-helix transcriptional regulator [Providencia]APC14121.1 DNA-binding transcriptional repressor PuuR,putative zinc finger/helix-turn-helix protein, YgiT family,Helix-turn-helix [Providencia rettgeri]MBG5929382.1 helix-turn-helix transcriptional regulator [Providencia rettgeri]OZS73045.1 XRE family transcriptional regulator [Providencia rettgeri]HEC8326440.1 helix-turn-helix transcriptional regulator [Providencia rettgeri]
MKNYLTDNELDKMELIIGREISHLRKKKGLTGEQLGLLLGVSQQQVSRYERAETKLAISMLCTIVNLLDISLPNFFERIFSKMENDNQSFHQHSAFKLECHDLIY